MLSEEKLLEQKLRTCFEEFSDGIGFGYFILRQMSSDLIFKSESHTLFY